MEDDFEQALQEKLGNSLEEGIAAKISEFGGLLTRRAAVRLLCKENGINLEQALGLSDALKSRVPFSFAARVERVFMVQEYHNNRDRSMRLHISDKSGEATLVIWNEQIKMAGSASAGDSIECTGAYARAGEISIGKSGRISLSKARQLAEIGSIKEGLCSLEGIVREVSPAREFRDRKTGEGRRMLPFTVCQGEKCSRAVLWLSSGEGAPKLSPGDSVLLKDAAFRNNELHLNSFSSLALVSSSSEIHGRLESIGAKGEELVFRISGEEYSCESTAGLAMLGIVSIPEGVSVGTIAALKSSELSGSSAIYSCDGRRLLKLRLVL